MHPIDLNQVRWLGHRLHRPECVLCTADGSLFVSDTEGGVCHIGPSGVQQRILAVDAPVPLLPNGIALRHDGTFLLANLGCCGGVWTLNHDGHTAPFLTEVEGQSLPPTNFVLIDASGRTWITVSTRKSPRDLGYRPGDGDGFIVCVDKRGPRIVADGLGYTNEVQVHPSGRWLYVNETFGRRLSRFPITASSDLGKRETITEFTRGVFPDGLGFDTEGGTWIASIVSNRVVRISEHGMQQVIIDDSDDDHVEWVEQAYLNHCMGRPHLDKPGGEVLANISSIAFGGPNRTIVYLGALQGRQIAYFPTSFQGVEPAHWHWTPRWARQKIQQ